MRFVEIFLSAFIIWSCAFAEKGLEKELSDVVLTTGLGKIRGTYLTSNSGRNFYAFRGIRYAQPPVGELRFKDPVPVDHWNGIFDATEDGPMCPQPAFNGSDVSEDCLRLNVYTHELPSESNPNIRRPVIVYLHPGGFYAVSGQSKNFAGPQYLMNGNIVLVTLNYRLGSLGFISTGTAEAPGNAGLKDQVTALRWIKLHIGRFGGDPNSVTLLGYSAGAVSITLHMISPMSRNLFHKAIVMSGSATSQWGFPSNQMHLARRQARLLNCSTDSSVSDMISCLRTKHYFEFANSFASMFEFGQGNPVLLWKPVVEEDFGQERFLTEDPVRAYQDGRFMKIPLIAGITKDEFVGPAIAILKNDTLREQLDKNFEELAAVCFQYERNTPRSRNISAQLRKNFLDDGPLQLNKSLVGLAHLFGDGLISFGMHRFVHLAARLTKVYYYRFSYQGRYSHLYYPDNKPYGVVHHDDLLYLLVGPFIAPQFFEEDPEYRTMQRLTRMFTAFAYKGMHRFVRLAARYTKVFNYRFSYQGRFSHLYYPQDKPYGVVHHDDLLYLFAVPSRTPLFPNTDPDHPNIERLTRMWTEFAKNGDPNKPNDEYLRGVRWRPFSFRREPYLDIGEDLVMKEGLYTERFAVWKRLFPLSWTPKRNRGMIPNGDDFSEDYPIDMDHDNDHIHDHDNDHIHDNDCQHNRMN